MSQSGAPSVFDSMKPHFGGILSLIGTLVLSAVVGFGNYRAKDTHSSDEVQQLKTDVADLKRQIANDMATRREVDDVKSTVIRIEDKLDKVLQYRRNP